MLYYLPIEPYKARYTEQLRSWMTKAWSKAGINWIAIDGDSLSPMKHKIGQINTGVVLDAFRRSEYAMSQTTQLLDLIESGHITSDDVIYLEDFFHPGAEAIPYCCHLKGVKPKVYAYWWAQSVDEYDFTHPMRNWMKYHETAQLNWLDGIFVACPSMKDLIEEYLSDHVGDGVLPFPDGKIHVVGLPFDSEAVLSRTPGSYQCFVRGTDLRGVPYANSAGEPFKPTAPHKNQVVFSSRWDKEKNPEFFLYVAENLLRKNLVPRDTTFVLCTGHPVLRSNIPHGVLSAQSFAYDFRPNFRIATNLSKEEYYQILCESKIQFNCANQDWVSYTLLEASVCGCIPVYPRFRSFPETLDGMPGENYLYTHKNLNSAMTAIQHYLTTQDDEWSAEAIRKRSWIHRRFDNTWVRMLAKMGIKDDRDFPIFDLRDPFAPDKSNWR